MNDALKNSNSATSTQTMGHSKERFQMPMLLKPIPGSITGAVALTGAADAVIASYLVPIEWGAVQIIKYGFHTAAATGAVTTPGTMKLTIGGVDVKDVDATVIELPTAASLAQYKPIEQNTNRTTKSTNLTAEPNYPYATAEELIQLRIGTQGVGGTQTVFPYLIVRVAPDNRNLYTGTWREADGTSAP